MPPAIYDTIVQELQVRRGGIKDPLRLPVERDLAKDLSVGRDTIRRALAELERSGAVIRRRGKGTYLQPIRYTAKGNLKGTTIGFIPPWWADSTSAWFTSNVFEGVARWADEHKCRISVLHADRHSHDEQKWMERTTENELAGVVWVHPEMEQLPVIEHTACHLPSVVLGRGYPGKGLHHVMPDYNKVVSLIDSHLISKGHNDYTVIGTGVLAAYSQNWLNALEQVFEQRGATFDPKQHYLDIKPFVRQKLAKLLMEFYEPIHPEVSAYVLTSSSYLLPLIADADFRTKLEKNLSIITFDYGLYPIETYWPGHSISHVACNWPQMGRKAMDVLEQLYLGKDMPEVLFESVEFKEGSTVHNKA
jgi:DNA-binding LacI/PurR family transcriptional regulator